MKSQKHNILILPFLICCFLGYSTIALYCRLVQLMQEDEEIVDAHYRSLPSTPVGATLPTMGFSSVNRHSRLHAGGVVSQPVGMPTIGFQATGSYLLPMSSQAQLHSVGGGSGVGGYGGSAATGNSGNGHTCSPSLPMTSTGGTLAMVLPRKAGHFYTAASELTGGETTMSDDPTHHSPIRRASDPGDVDDENEIPLGDVPYVFLLALLAVYGHFFIKKV